MSENSWEPTSDRQGTEPEEFPTDNQFPAEDSFFQQLQHYDAEAWDALLTLYAPQLRRDIARSLDKRGLPTDWSDDIEQETWVTIIRHIDAFVWESEDKFYHWFRSIATFHIKNLDRKTKKRYVSLEEIDEDADDSGLSLDLFMYTQGLIDDSPEVVYALQESLQLLDRAMQTLKPRERAILLRRILYQDSVSQLAADYNLKPESVSVLLVRAKHTVAAVAASLNH